MPGLETINDFGGIRRGTRLADEILCNFLWLEQDGWKVINEMAQNLINVQTPEAEIESADFIDHNLKGFGPKQARNLLQSLGLTKYEIPIDSRVSKWMNNFGFPLELSPAALSDGNYYKFVSEGFRKMCAACNIYPCLLDAAIFSSFDSEWPENRLVW